MLNVSYRRLRLRDYKFRDFLASSHLIECNYIFSSTSKFIYRNLILLQHSLHSWVGGPDGVSSTSSSLSHKLSISMDLFQFIFSSLVVCKQRLYVSVHSQYWLTPGVFPPVMGNSQLTRVYFNSQQCYTINEKHVHCGPMGPWCTPYIT